MVGVDISLLKICPESFTFHMPRAVLLNLGMFHDIGVEKDNDIKVIISS